MLKASDNIYEAKNLSNADILFATREKKKHKSYSVLKSTWVRKDVST
jgi:hypothetical protein